MKWDFSDVAEMDGGDLVTVPAGTYLCQVEEVRSKTSLEGNEVWGIKLVVAAGPSQGRVAAWDNLVWSPRAIGRVKKILRLMGFSVEGQLQLEPVNLEGKRIQVCVGPQSYRDPTTGTAIIRNRVPYDGYLEAPAGEESGEGDIPF